MADNGQRTEQPTERRLQKAREGRQFPVSKEFVAGDSVLGFVTLLASFSAQWLSKIEEIAQFLLGWGFRAEVNRDTVTRLFRDYLCTAAAPAAGSRSRSGGR